MSDKFKGKPFRKAFKQSCNFMKPSKMMKNGRMIDAKCCTAYIPGFEVTEDRSVCEHCSVPDMGVKGDRCRFFVPLDLPANAPTRWYCRLLGNKYIEPEQCTPAQCQYYDPVDNLKWEIGRPVSVQDKQNVQNKEAGSSLKKLIPKSPQIKKSVSNNDSDGFEYF